MTIKTTRKHLSLLCPFFLLFIIASTPSFADDPKIITEQSSLVYPDFWHTPMGIHRGTPTLLKMLLGDEVRFNNPQGIACNHLYENGEETPQLTVVGVNSGQHCLVFNPNMLSLKYYGSKGSGIGEFFKPIGVAMTPEGHIAVADSGNHRIVLLRLRNDSIRWIGTLGHRGSKDGEFENPRWVTYDTLGRLYVSDTGNNRIQVFNTRGKFLYSFGDNPNAPNSVIQPQGIAVVDRYEPYSARRMSAIYVVDQFHGRIQKFSLKGRFLAQAIPSQFDEYLVYFNSLALDYYNNVWVIDRSNHQIHKFDRHLQYIDTWGSKGKKDGQLYSPRGIAVYRHYGQLFVLEKASAQYLWIGTDIRDIKLHKLKDDEGLAYLNIDFMLTEKAWLEAWIADDNDKIIRRLTKRKKYKQGRLSFDWDGEDAYGYLAEAGKYKFIIEAEASYSSATYYKKREVKHFMVK